MKFSDLKRVKPIPRHGEDIIDLVHDDGPTLKRHLGVWDLTAFGIAAIIGAGIFSTIGKASAAGGPGVVLLFLFTAIACGFAAFAYAEFASLVPVSGSAYTYSYVTFGELFAWIIGWALIMEYAIGNMVVAISWSDYFVSLLEGVFKLDVPNWMTMDYFSSKHGFEEITKQLANGQTIEVLSKNPEFVNLVSHYQGWIGAPMIGNFHVILDIPALVINMIITYLVYIGIKESRNASNIMVMIKIIVVILVIVVGVFYVKPENWHPFLPNGVGGLLAGISSVFFAYIGFDAISTTAEECKDPQRDLPKGIMYSIIICTVLYIAIALIITGIVNYKELNVGDPLAYVFSKVNELSWLAGIVSFSAVIAMASVMLVFQMGQPRIWMVMSRDGLLPKRFSKLHPKYSTPAFATLITGLLVGIPILFLDMSFVADLTSLGTLFAFVLVCGGIIILELTPNAPRGKYKVPYLNGKYLIPFLFIMTFVLLDIFAKEWFLATFLPESFSVFLNNVPLYLFFVVFGYISVLSFRRSVSTIPVLGLLTCLYMMSQLGLKTWTWFLTWLAIGLLIYFNFGIKNSKLNKAKHN